MTEVPYRCPRCDRDVDRSKSRYGVFWSCHKCKGRGVALAVLRRVVERDALNALWRAAIEAGEQGARRCPTCANPMLAVTSARAEGAPELDVCRGCQLVWFDEGEYHRMPAAEPERTTDVRKLPEAARREIAMLEVRKLAERASLERRKEGAELWTALSRALVRLFR